MPFKEWKMKEAIAYRGQAAFFFPRRDSLIALSVGRGLGGAIENNLQHFINIGYFISSML